MNHSACLCMCQKCSLGLNSWQSVFMQRPRLASTGRARRGLKHWRPDQHRVVDKEVHWWYKSARILSLKQLSRFVVCATATFYCQWRPCPRAPGLSAKSVSTTSANGAVPNSCTANIPAAPYVWARWGSARERSAVLGVVTWHRSPAGFRSHIFPMTRKYSLLSVFLTPLNTPPSLYTYLTMVATCCPSLWTQTGRCCLDNRHAGLALKALGW